mgnify:CR=1 FL=1
MFTELQANKAEYVIQNVVTHEDIIPSNGPDGEKVSLTHYAKHEKDARNIYTIRHPLF